VRAFALQDDLVAALLLEDRRQSLPWTSSLVEDWTKKLARTKAGGLENTLGNLLMILKRDEKLAHIRYTGSQPDLCRIPALAPTHRPGGTRIQPSWWHTSIPITASSAHAITSCR
jgi:hypothetical protein